MASQESGLQNGPLRPLQSPATLPYMFASESYRNCLEVERLLMTHIRDPKVCARDHAFCANALDKILERKRILRGTPKIKDMSIQDLDAAKERKRRRKWSDGPAFSDPTASSGKVPPPQ